MKVLSLFDGMSCGMLAMLEAGIKVDRYVAFEIDKYAIQTSLHNFPFIEQRGDVFAADFTEFLWFDWLIGGSPCTYWSIAQKNNRETEASGMGWELFSQYVRALHEAKPRYFVYENNKSMSTAIRESITRTFGFEPICINSSLVSAQNRQRLYWVGRRNEDGTYSRVNVDQPEDRGILLRDVLDGATDREKCRCVTASVGRTTTREYFQKNQNTMAYEPVRVPEYGVSDKSRPINALYPNNCGGFEHRMFSNNPHKQQVDMIAEPVNTTKDGKSQTIKAQYQQPSIANICCYHSTYGATGVAEPVCAAERGRWEDGRWVQQFEAREDGKTNSLTKARKDNNVCEPVRVGTYPNNEKNQAHDSQQYRIYSADGKGVTLCGNGGGMGAKTGLYAIPIEFSGGIPVKAVSFADGKTYAVYAVKDGQITIKEKQYPIKLVDGFYIIRKLTVSECKRLQTVPDWYEFPVSDTRAYQQLGNGWTILVISHLLAACLRPARAKDEPYCDSDGNYRFF